ncbi:magnesium Mg(2+) and cobalt Co(2+) transport protein CorA [Aequorivita sublithincola DSM 14238]|uniref:Magnesium transport protein CorA n=1 Tax=Aequorivita sublithincola (strain DSM 14238 / LMG 21431 / ACAM 643 / 9-3) TaxID=746697 RepID=I3YYQ6_AEQSU|nr:magnesium/cobalt transporter CorA [Aequorivita sublithincola]AFL82124.1 magnesium Mg(2+) and cobalt Co(2+) transport protein CorA [Aequorivita sublithincola DSM 14238]
MAARRKNNQTTKIQPKRARNLSPGTVTYTGKKTTTVTKLDIIDYSKEHYHRFETNDIHEAFNYEDSTNITWINVNGLSNTNDIITLGNHFELHPLIQEDIVSTYQRPKIDEYEEYLFIVFKMLHYDDEKLTNEHISLVMGKDYVLTFQEAEGDVFEDLRERLEHGKGRIRGAGADYLMFAILDAVVDNYFSVVEFLSNKVELLEDKLFDDKEDTNITQEIQDLKKEILKIRKAVMPLREVINRLEKIENPLIEERTNKYIRDLYDNIIQVNESVEIYREMIWGLMDMYMTTISNKMNEVMKVLTIMASIFIPLTFLAGIYGMNFDNIPELHYKNSYFYLLGVMALVFLGMIWYFKRKKWL